MIDTLSSFGPAIANHLWQSTAFAAVAWLLSLLLRKHSARLRYAVWLAASIKFLIPFSLLIGLGGLLPKPHTAVASSQSVLYSTMDTVGQPFSDAGPSSLSTKHAADQMGVLPQFLPLLLLALWFCGMAAVLLVWIARWHQVSAALRRTTPANSGREARILRRLGGDDRVELRLSQEPMEPGIFGILRPKLIWPEQLSEQLDDEHIEAIVAHELAHVRRLDNLTAALHMLVQAVFWFHPMVWWMQRHMIEERECACDEAVVECGGRAEIYAESLLKACRFCVESPVMCVAGISGADLAKRVRSIMTLRTRRIGRIGRVMLTALSITTVAIPIAFGISAAQQTKQTAPLQFEVATIKPGTPSPKFDAWSGSAPDGRFLMINTPLRRWVMMGLSIHDSALKAPSWLETSRFDLNAKLPTDIPLDRNHDPRPEMMKALLVERFGLKWHEEIQTAAGYELVIDKKVLAQPATEKERLLFGDHLAGTGSGPTAVQGNNMSLAEFAKSLSDVLGKTVVDSTHVSGRFDIKLQWRPSDEAELERERRYGKQYGLDVDNLPGSVFDAVREQLGLRLQSAKVQSKVIVVDQINRQPTEN